MIFLNAIMTAECSHNVTDAEAGSCSDLQARTQALIVRVCRAIFADIWLAFFQEGQQQSCEQVDLITGDGKAKIFGEAMCEVRILPPVSSLTCDTWIVHTFAG